MTIDPKLRRKTRQKGSKRGGALMLNIRVRQIRKKGEPETTRTTVRDALQTLLDTGRMPQGWQFMYVDWKNPAKHGNSWSGGWPERAHSDDPDEFMEAFRRVVQTEIRMAQIRPLRK